MEHYHEIFTKGVTLRTCEDTTKKYNKIKGDYYAEDL